MRHMLLPATTLALWILNILYVIAVVHPAIPITGRGAFEAGQRLLATITVVVTVAWLLKRQGIEYRIGYRHGQEDRDK